MDYLTEMKKVLKQAKIAPKELKKFTLRELWKETEECLKILVKHPLSISLMNKRLETALKYSKFLEEIEKELEEKK